MTYERFLEKLREIRKKRNISTEKLAERLGKTKQQYYMIESGRSSLRMRDYFLLCEELEISSTELLFEEEDKKEYMLLKESISRLSARDAQIIKTLIILMD